MKSILLSCLVFSLLVGPAAYAQGVGASGQVRGTVFDPSGSVVPGASVDALDIRKGTRYSTTTDSSGQYQFPSLPPSAYESWFLNNALSNRDLDETIDAVSSLTLNA